MDNSQDKQENSILSTFNRLKLTFNKLKKIKKKMDLEEYLNELSPYADKLLEDLETDLLKYEKGFCNLRFNKDQGVVELTFVLLFKNNLDNSVEKKELKRYVDKSIFEEEAINGLILKSKSFEIKKR